MDCADDFDVKDIHNCPLCFDFKGIWSSRRCLHNICFECACKYYVLYEKTDCPVCRDHSKPHF
ncbi:MAG: E3 ubiquitin-protein ligase rad18, partial [Paramarteilia canceri]